MNSYKLLFDWQISMPDNWQGEYDKESGQYIFYPDNSDLTIRITPFHAERDGILAPREVMEDAYIRTVPVSARQRNLDLYIPSGFEAKIYDDVLTEDSNTIYVVYVGYYSAGELLSISVWSTNRDEGEQALNVLNMFSPMLAATYAVVDPELTYSVPKNTTIHTGLDVLSHALEAYSSVMDDAVAELMALEALRIVFRSLPLCVNENDKAARNEMAYASLLAGVAQSKCGCVIPHAASCPLTVYHNVPHGLGCGVLQIPTIDYNRDVCKEKYKRVLEYICLLYTSPSPRDCS